MLRTECTYGEFFLAVDWRGRLFHYVVESVDGSVTLTSTSVESWLEVRPNGVVEVVDEPVDRTQELRDERNGGPSWVAAPVHSSRPPGTPW